MNYLNKSTKTISTSCEQYRDVYEVTVKQNKQIPRAVKSLTIGLSFLFSVTALCGLVHLLATGIAHGLHAVNLSPVPIVLGLFTLGIAFLIGDAVNCK